MTDARSVPPALLERIETQRSGCQMAGSPLYSDVLLAVGEDVRSGGPCLDLLAGIEDAPFGDAALLRFLAALHRLVLSREAPDLARHYPSAGGRPARHLAPDVVATVDAHRSAISAALAIPVQTNEVGRSAALLGGYLEVARIGKPLRILEVGASAGLNLLFDRFHYVADHQAFGPPDSPLRFTDPWAGAAPDLAVPLQVASRRGCDTHPLDPSSEADRLRLRSFVWPDQAQRLARLDAALEVARLAHDEGASARIDEAAAAAWAGSVLRDPVPGVTTVLSHSIVFQYLAPPDRQAMLQTLDEAGARATADAPLAWLRLEPAGDRAELRLTTWPDERTRVLATSAFHGPPVAWLAG